MGRRNIPDLPFNMFYRGSHKRNSFLEGCRFHTHQYGKCGIECIFSHIIDIGAWEDNKQLSEDSDIFPCMHVLLRGDTMLYPVQKRTYYAIGIFLCHCAISHVVGQGVYPTVLMLDVVSKEIDILPDSSTFGNGNHTEVTQ